MKNKEVASVDAYSIAQETAEAEAQAQADAEAEAEADAELEAEAGYSFDPWRGNCIPDFGKSHVVNIGVVKGSDECKNKCMADADCAAAEFI